MQQDLAQYEDESSLHYYRTELPNILPQLGLDVYEIATYYIIKMAAGDRGSCFKSNSTLCDLLKIGKEKFIEVKKSLEKKGLIRITKRKHANGSAIPDLIQIIDLWPLNMQELQKMREEKQRKHREEVGGVVGNADHPSRQRRPKQEPLEKEPSLEQQQELDKSASGSPPTVPIAAVVSKDREKKKEQPPPKIKTTKTKSLKIYDCLKEIDIQDTEKVWISSMYPEECVKNAIEWATSPDTDVTTTLVQAIKWACKAKPRKPKSKISIYEELCSHFTHLEEYNQAICYLKEFDGIAFERGMHHKNLKLNENRFWEKFKKMCDEFGINFSRE